MSLSEVHQYDVPQMLNYLFKNYRKFPEFLDARNFAVINLKFKQTAKTLAYFIKKMQME